MSPLVDWFLWIGKYVASFKRCLNQQLFGRLAIERVSGMQPLNVQRFSLAFGVASALLYLGCVVFMAILGKQTTITFFNSLLHGLDVRLIIRCSFPRHHNWHHRDFYPGLAVRRGHQCGLQLGDRKEIIALT